MAFTPVKARFLMPDLSYDKIKTNYEKCNNYSIPNNKEYILP